MEERNRRKKALTLFFIITIGISALVETAIIVLGQFEITAILMWVPAIGAYIAKYVYYRKEKGFLGFKKCKPRYILWSILIPFLYIGIAYGIYWIIYPETMQVILNIPFCVMFVLGLFLSMITAMGEEIGWRGFMVPMLYQQIGFGKTLIISSLIWGGWHIPLLASGLYMSGTSVWYQIPMFMLHITATGCIISILTLMSKSVWPAIFLHSAHNHFDQIVFGPYTTGNNKMYFVSETGIFTIIISWIMVFILIHIWKTKFEKESI